MKTLLQIRDGLLNSLKIRPNDSGLQRQLDYINYRINQLYKLRPTVYKGI